MVPEPVAFPVLVRERDAAGRLTAKTTPETRTEYRYDAADRLLEIRRRRHDAAGGG
ncbi:RHS repeat protein, partial [Salmonella enterica subsp. enterica serovar Mbandaka]|nr:RHS repeat protein [Salmonella enterica subsp. enterica serovar Mbandaka]